MLSGHLKLEGEVVKTGPGILLFAASLICSSMQLHASQTYQKMHSQHHSAESQDGHHGHHNGAYEGHDHHGDSYMGHGDGTMPKQKKHGRHNHDEVNMPGLQGVDTTDVEISDLKTIFVNHAKISRRVENIENGIRTITESEDETLRESIITHVAFMVTRLEEGRNPQVIIQSPTLDLLFDRYDEIDTVMEMTATGIEVVQTSGNPEVVALLQKHAAEVSDMAEHGMAAVHERMMNGH